MNTKPSTRLLSLIACAAMAPWIVGCKSTATIQPAQQPVSGPLGSEGIIPLNTVSQLEVSLTSNPQTSSDQSLADTVTSHASGALNAQGYNIIPSQADVAVQLSVGSEEFDRSGNYYVYRGTVQGEARRLSDGRVIARRDIITKGGRALGQDAARSNLGSQLGMETAGWIQESLTPTSIGLAANDLTLTIPLHRNISSYASEFIRVCKGIRGISKVTLIQQDHPSRTVVFRIVYYPQQIPEGILNRLATHEELDIRAR